MLKTKLQKKRRHTLSFSAKHVHSIGSSNQAASSPRTPTRSRRSRSLSRKTNVLKIWDADGDTTIAASDSDDSLFGVPRASPKISSSGLPEYSVYRRSHGSSELTHPKHVVDQKRPGLLSPRLPFKRSAKRRSQKSLKMSLDPVVPSIAREEDKDDSTGSESDGDARRKPVAVAAPIADAEDDLSTVATVQDNLGSSSSDETEAPSLSADGDNAVVINDANDEDKTEPPEESSDEGTLGPNSSQGSIESLKHDDDHSAASTMRPLKTPKVTLAQGSSERADPEEDNSQGSGLDDSFSMYSDEGNSEGLSVSESERAQTTDNYVTAGEEERDGYTSGASRRTNPFFSCNETEFHSAMSSAGEEDSDNSAASGRGSRRVTITKERMNNVLMDRVGSRAQNNQKGSKSSSADADYQSCDDSSSVYTSPLPLVRRSSNSGIVIARPSSTISTSSAEYHTPGYASSGDESAGLLAGDDDSEFSEMEDFAFGPNMAAALLASSQSAQFKPQKPSNMQPLQSQSDKMKPQERLFPASTQSNKHNNVLNQTKTPQMQSSTQPVKGQRSQFQPQSHSEAIEEATKWLNQTNQLIESSEVVEEIHSDYENVTFVPDSVDSTQPTAATAQHTNNTSNPLNLSALSNDMSLFDPFGAEASKPDASSDSDMKDGNNPFAAAFNSDFSPNVAQKSSFNPFKPTAEDSFTDTLETSTSALVFDDTIRSDPFNSTAVLQSTLASDSLMIMTDPNDPLAQSDPLVDSAAPLVFTQALSKPGSSEHKSSARLSNNPFIDTSHAEKGSSAADVAPPVISEPTCDEDFQQDWSFMLRHPPEKQLGKRRRWMNVDVKFDRENSILKIYDKTRGTEISWDEILVSNRLFVHDVNRQKYDEKGKVHTLKLVETNYRRRNQFDKLVATTIFQQPLESRYIAEHRIRAKLGTIDYKVMESFLKLFDSYQFQNKTVKNLQQGSFWSHPEIHMELVDTLTGDIDTRGEVSNESISTSLYCLSFFVKSPEVRIGINDERVKGVEVVRRSDILPMKTDAWIKFDDVKFHHSVDKKLYLDERTIVFQPIDACRYKLAELKVRQHFYKELPMKPLITLEQVGGVVKMEAEFFLPSIQKLDFKFDAEMRRCENILLVIPVPEQWVNMLRYERPILGEGSVKAAKRKTGHVSKTKVHGVRIQVTAGVAKYEHSYKAIVWRINRLPGKTSVSICSYKMFVQLISPEGVTAPFPPDTEAQLSYSMSWTVASGAVLRSMAVTNLPVEALKKVDNKADFCFNVKIQRKTETDA